MLISAAVSIKNDELHDEFKIFNGISTQSYVFKLRCTVLIDFNDVFISIFSFIVPESELILELLFEHVFTNRPLERSCCPAQVVWSFPNFGLLIYFDYFF